MRYEKFYADQFPFPDFYNRFLCSFVVADDNGSIVSAGGVIPISEVIIVTDKDRSPRTKHHALYQVLDVSKYIASHFGYRQLHAFTQEEVWTKRMLKDGFKNCKGNALVIQLGENNG